MSKITFAEDAWEEYLYWQSQDKKTFKKDKQSSKIYPARTFFR